MLWLSLVIVAVVIFVIYLAATDSPLVPSLCR